MISRTIAALWIVFLVVWLISSFTAKRSARGGASRILVRVGVMVALYLYFRSTKASPTVERLTFDDSIVRWAGVALCAIGIAFAFWARATLGKNWGMPMSVKAEPGLVTSGPYGIVRHPIYTGGLLAMLGTAIATEVYWFVPFAIFLAYFTYAATQEEKQKALEFPSQYPDYKRHTKMLIPFLF